MRKIYEEFASEPKLFKPEVVLETTKLQDGGESLKYTMVNKPFDPKVGWNPQNPELNPLDVPESYEDENGDLIEQFVEEDYYEEDDFEEGEFEEGEYEDGEDEERDFNEEDDDLPVLEEIDGEEVITTSKTIKKREEVISLSEDDYQKKLDEEFDNFVHNYDDEEIGELDDQEIQGERRELDIAHYVKDLLENPKYNLGRYYEDEEEKEISQEEVDEFANYLGGLAFKKGDNPFSKVSKEEIIQYTLEAIRRQKKEEEEREGEEEDILEPYLKEKEEQWDCESIISTYSNTENHPKLIFEEDEKKKIKLSAKSGLPLNVLPTKTIIKKKKVVTKDIGNSRDKLETAEEKKLRKQMVKESKREKRAVKKATKDAFKEEEVKQGKMNAIPQQKQKIVVKY